MINISEENIREVLEIYKPEQRVLKSASIGYPRIEGTFLVGPTCYTIGPLEHATDIDIQLCLNQLAYVGLSEAIRHGLDSIFEDINFKNLQKEGMYIIESNKRFKRQISPNKYITGDIIIKNKIKRKGIILINTEFQFENKSCFGNLELAIIDKQIKGKTK
mgnify:CR=1 FL=1